MSAEQARTQLIGAACQYAVVEDIFDRRPETQKIGLLKELQVENVKNLLSAARRYFGAVTKERTIK